MTDYVSRDDVRRFIVEAFSDGHFATNYDYAILSDKIGELPAADVQPIDRWINAKTNPPIATDGETSDYVLVLRASGMQCVCYYVYDDDEGNYWCSEDEKSIYDIDEITRWQPLPKPPKDGDTE